MGKNFQYSAQHDVNHIEMELKRKKRLVMDEQIKAIIEKLLDSMIRIESHNNGIKWIRENMKIKSENDLVLGYIIGKMEIAAITTFSVLKETELSEKEMEKQREEIRELVGSRLPRIQEQVKKELNK